MIYNLITVEPVIIAIIPASILLWHDMNCWALALFFFTIWCGVEIGRKLSWSLVPIFLIAALNGIYTTAIRFDPSAASMHFDWLIRGRFSGISTITLFAAAFFFVSMNANKKLYVMISLSLVCLFSMIASVVNPGGFSGNPSMNGILIVSTAGFGLQFFRSFGRWPCFAFLCVVILSTFATEASMPLGASALFLLVSYWLTRKSLMLGILTSFALIIGGFIAQGSSLFSSTGRTALWGIVFREWVDSGHFLLGKGLGVYFHDGLQITQSINHPAFAFYAHNDWLQICYDLGLVGILAALFAFGWAVYSSRKDAPLCASIVAFGFSAFGNFPMHLPVHAYVGCALLWLVYVKGDGHA